MMEMKIKMTLDIEFITEEWKTVKESVAGLGPNHKMEHNIHYNR